MCLSNSRVVEVEPKSMAASSISVWIDAYAYVLNVLTIPTVMLNKIAKGNIFAKAGPPSDITIHNCQCSCLSVLITVDWWCTTEVWTKHDIVETLHSQKRGRMGT